MHEGSRNWLWLAVMAGVCATALSYAVTRAFVWDEGYHLLAAQQIAQGKLPYIDFCFPQTPLNAFLNGAIVRLFGQHWQPVHVAATLFSMGAMALVAQYFHSFFPAKEWRSGLAIVTALFVGLNSIVLQFGTIGQAYGIALFFTTAAYRVALATPARVTAVLPFFCGVLVCIAAGSTLLVAPTVPVLLFWIWKYDRVGLRWRKSVAYIAGALVPFLPLLALFVKGPRETFFNIVQFHALYRRADWPGATFHDVRVVTSWLDSTEALSLLLLGVLGIIFVAKKSDWARERRAEFYLAAWVAVALGLYISTPHPTFTRYFIFLTPFMAVLAMPGLYYLASAFGFEQRPSLPAGIAAVLMVLMFAKAGIESTEETTWKSYDNVVRKVAEVTPKGGRVFADEVVYFALQMNPPSGMEVSYTHMAPLSAEQRKLFHIVSEAELRDQFNRHEFDTVQSCSDPEMQRMGLPSSYRYRWDEEECTVFWGRRTQ